MSTQKKWTYDDWQKWQRKCILEDMKEEQESRRATYSALQGCQTDRGQKSIA